MAAVATDTPPRRPEAERNLEAILDAAVQVLAAQPRANMTEVARASGLSRQTVYAHFASREQLIEAVVARAMRDASARMDSAELDKGPAGAALERLLAVSWTSVATHGALLDAALAALTPEAFEAHHAPVHERLQALVARGQREGAFDPEIPPAWLLSTFFALVHAAGQEVTAGRLDVDIAAASLRATVLRAFSPG